MWGMPIHIRKAIVQINGTEKVESVTMCDITPEGKLIQGSEKTIDVDFVCIAGGLYPLTELAAVIGCPFQYIEELGGHVPIHNEQLETPLKDYMSRAISRASRAQKWHAHKEHSPAIQSLNKMTKSSKRLTK